MDATALLQQQILSTVSDPLAQAALRPHLSAAIESATDTEQDVSPSTSRLIRQLLRIDGQDPYHTQYHWPSTTFDGRELLALERLGSRDYVEEEDRHSLIQTLKSTLNAGLSVLGYVGSVLDKPYAATRGVIGGMGALLRGDFQNAAKGFNQILLMLPFSESYLKGLYTSVGLPIPDEHLSGREALEMWGAPKNLPGFHPIKQPIDALFDAAGLVLDLFAVPYLPRFGALSAKGQQLYRLGQGAKIVAKMEEAIQQLGTKVSTLPSHVLQNLKDKPLAEILETLGRTVKLSEPELQHLRLWSAELPAGGTELERALRNALGQSDTAALGALLRDIPTHLRFYQALEGGLRPIPAVSLEGRAQELRQGVRVPLVLESPWPVRSIFEALGLPTRIEIGTGETTAQALETVGNWIGVRHLRALFDWTRKDVADAVAGPAMSLAVDRLHHVSAAAKDLLVQWRAWQASMANMAAKYAQLAQLGNNEVGVRTFGDLLRYIVEHSRKVNGTINEKAAALARQIFGNQPVEAGLMDLVRDLTATVEGELVPTAVAFTQKLQQLGAPIKPWQSPWAAWFPRYTPSTTAESGWAAIGPKIFTAKQAAKGKSRQLALDVPGGTLLLNSVSKDLVLIKPARKAATDGVVAVTDMAGRFWMVGDYVRTPEGRLGRIIQFKPNDTALLRYSGGETQALLLTDLTKTPPPAGFGTYIPMDRLSREEQFLAAQAWLQHHNITLPQIANKKELMRKTLQRYLVHRYAQPFLQDVPEDLRRLFFAETPFASIKEATQHVKKIYQDAGIQVSTRQLKSLGRVLYEKQGTSALLVDYLRTLRTDRGLFSTDILDDLTRRLSYNADAMMALTGVHQMFRLGAFVDETASRGLALRDAWGKLRWPKSNRALTGEGFNTLWNHLPPELIQRANEVRLTTGTDLDQIIRVPEEVITHAQRLLRVLLPQTEEAIWIEKIVRKYLGWVSSWLTVPRPAYQLRNATSNAISGAIADAPYDTLPFLKHYYNALTHGLKGEWPKLPWYDEMAQLGVWGGQQKLADITLEAAPATKPLATLLHPLAAPPDAKTIANTLANWPGYLESLKGKRPSPMIEAGRQTFGLIEGVGRAAVYMAAREAGATPAQAKALVDRVLYDYSRLSGFERRYMQPTLMFYGWLRQNLGYLLPRVTVDLGSGPAKLLRGLTVIQDRFGRGELPKWMQDNLGFPLWDGENGQTVVVRALGLPLEDLSLLDFELPRLVAKVYARTNPVFKGAYMLTTGEDPFTDLPLREAQPAVERLAKNLGIDTSRWYHIRPPLNIAEQFVPYTSVLGYYARLLQSRHAPTPLHEALARGIDFLSGVKIGSYDLEEQQLNELTELLQERLRSMPGVRTYFRPYIATPYPTPALEKHMELYKLLEKRWRQEAEERKKLKRQQALPLQLGGLEFR